MERTKEQILKSFDGGITDTSGQRLYHRLQLELLADIRDAIIANTAAIAKQGEVVRNTFAGPLL